MCSKQPWLLSGASSVHEIPSFHPSFFIPSSVLSVGFHLPTGRKGWGIKSSIEITESWSSLAWEGPESPSSPTLPRAGTPAILSGCSKPGPGHPRDPGAATSLEVWLQRAPMLVMDLLRAESGLQRGQGWLCQAGGCGWAEFRPCTHLAQDRAALAPPMPSDGRAAAQFDDCVSLSTFLFPDRIGPLKVPHYSLSSPPSPLD